MRVSFASLRLMAVVLISAGLTVAAVSAQDGNRQRGGGGGGGFGGRPGGGGGGGGMGGDPTFTLLRVDEVRTELEISPDQEEALKKLGEQMRPTRPEGVDFRSMSEEDRTKFFAKMQKESSEKMAEMKLQLDEVLFPEQMERLKEISLQAQGAQALGDPEVVSELKISDTQKKELDEVRESLREEMTTKMRELFSNRDGNSDMREQMTKMRSDMDEKIFAVLTPAQKTQFEEMKGEKFDLPDGALGGGRGGPGGGGDRGGDRGRAGGDRGRPGGDRGGRPSRDTSNE
ncbi:hypothetical protein Poly51_24050 [Rubripirellula tenax]|uniref:Periplasmic repressor CpxP n=1 Tax=Rubripirellula tenax TaxID=2528015 RepID=A0A5C6F7N9_9BACT|nr:Spy/CpxP family protein refolding chaperone [Rubripirellula tenax]TWU56494.1 hypothetical protein Poly51_24050 [Rubripirellula tenax]